MRLRRTVMHSAAGPLFVLYAILFPELNVPQDDTTCAVPYSSKIISRFSYIGFNFNVFCSSNIDIKIEPYVRESADYLGGVRYSTGGIILWDVKLWK